MQKLSEIQRAEDAAQRVVEDGHEQAKRILAEARAAAAEAPAQARASASAEASDRIAAAVAAAESEAARIREDEARELEVLLAEARGRLDAVVARVTRELVG